jgi:hypothetical protein
MMADEVLNLVLQFCSHIDLGALRQTGSLLKRYGSNDELWRILLLNSRLLSPCEMDSAMRTFGLSTYCQLFETVFKLQLPQGIIGFWRAEATSDFKYSGELLSITAVLGGLKCSKIEGDGTHKDLFRVRIKPHKDSGVHVLFFKLDHDLSQETLQNNRGCIGAAKVGLKRNSAGFTLARAGLPRQYVRVEQPSSSPSTELEADDNPFPINSLWSAYYGSHCKEIIQISSLPDHPAIEILPHITNQRQSRLICGTKIVGDPNVPAGRQSFIIDTTRSYDISSELAQVSQGLAITFTAGVAQVVDLTDRSPGVVRWLKGKGLINAGSDLWAPVWVELDCIIYNSDADIKFSILWQEPVHGVNIVIDFSPLPMQMSHCWN